MSVLTGTCACGAPAERGVDDDLPPRYRDLMLARLTCPPCAKAEDDAQEAEEKA